MMSWLRNWWNGADEPDQEIPVVDYSALETRQDGKIDPCSDTWLTVAGWAVAELNKLRESNDSTKHDMVKTSEIRGRIRVIKDLLELPNPPKERKRAPSEEEY